MTVSDVLFVSEIPAAQALVAAVRAGDEDTIRDVLTARSDAQMWALVLDLAAMVTDDVPDPERVLEQCCDVPTRLAYSDAPHRWPVEDLHTAMCVHRARTDPGATWVARGVAELRRRRAARQALIADLTATAAAVHRDKQAHRRVVRSLRSVAS